MNIAEARTLHKSSHTKTKVIDPNFKVDLEKGWMIPYLIGVDSLSWGRWNYWLDCQNGKKILPVEPIPQIEFISQTESSYSRKVIEDYLDLIPNSGKGSWSSYSSSEYINYFLDWLLFGFGSSLQMESPKEPNGCKGASNRLYQAVALDYLVLYPYDYFGDILGECSYGKSKGFFATPHSLAKVTVDLTISDLSVDNRTKSVYDPACGTGRLLLEASNYSLRLFGQDIDGCMVKCTVVNGYLYAPWLACPIGWLEDK